jgi:hypothetical protein
MHTYFCKIFELDTTTYKVLNFFSDDMFSNNPLILKLFLDIVVNKIQWQGRKQCISQMRQKNQYFCSLYHIICKTAISFIPNFIWTSAMMHERQSSRGLTDSLSYLALIVSINYQMIVMFNLSLIMQINRLNKWKK